MSFCVTLIVLAKDASNHTFTNPLYFFKPSDKLMNMNIFYDRLNYYQMKVKLFSSIQ
jgi:hypothetical protein